VQGRGLIGQEVKKQTETGYIKLVRKYSEHVEPRALAEKSVFIFAI
jgi:hypothetical protein